MKDAPRFLWDANAWRDPKVLRLRTRHDHGYEVWQILCCIMRENGAPYRIRLQDLELYVTALGRPLAEISAIVETCLQDDVALFQFDDEAGECFTAPALQERMAEWEEKKAKRSAAGKAGRTAQLMKQLPLLFAAPNLQYAVSAQESEQSPQKSEQSPEKSGDCPEVPIQSNTIQTNTIEEEGFGEDILSLARSMRERCPALTEAWIAWIDYRVKIKKPYKFEASIKQILNDWHDRPHELCQAIRRSIANSWQGLFEARGAGPPRGKQRAEAFRKNVKLWEQAEAEAEKSSA